ncbi:ParB-like nuclease domain [Arthrobacter phage Racecar]|nr:ParB-like nuclease domain protein [Arthrobacter phage Racecar]
MSPHIQGETAPHSALLKAVVKPAVTCQEIFFEKPIDVVAARHVMFGTWKPTRGGSHRKVKSKRKDYIMATATATKATASAKAEKTTEEKPSASAQVRRGRPRKTAAPKVDPMFSDTAEEKVDPEGLPETPELEETVSDQEALEASIDPQEPEVGNVEESPAKERRMNIETKLVPGKVAIATLTPDALKSLAFISTYSTKDSQSSSPRQHGYQREPMTARFPGIGRYYANEDNSHLITPIIASARVYSEKERVRFDFLFNRGDIATIHKEFGKDVFSIVDGQHRLGGLFWAWENYPNFNPDVPVMVYYGLRYANEAMLFDDINTNQRKLPKALIEATKVHMEAGEPSHQQIVREIAFALAQDGDSVWHGLVNMTGARDPQKPVTYEGLRRSTGNMMHDRLLGRLGNRGIPADKVAKRYWEMVSKACSPAWNNHPHYEKDETGELQEIPVKYRLKDLVGVAAVSKLGADIVITALERSKSDDEFWSAIADQVSRLGQVDWEKREDNPWMRSGAGFAGMDKLYKALYDLVYLDQAAGVAASPAEPEEAEATA